MNELIINKNDKIENLIYEVRGKQVMLDSDLATLYKCTNGTKTINLAVKRNIERFPEDFYFQLTKEEYDNLKFQFETSSLNSHGGIRKLPYVFTEQGVAMLATILKSKIAVDNALCEFEKYRITQDKLFKSNFDEFLANNKDITN